MAPNEASTKRRSVMLTIREVRRDAGVPKLGTRDTFQLRTCALIGEFYVMNETASQSGRRSNARSKSATWRRRYADHQVEISLHMSHLTLSYLRKIGRAFDGDLTMVIVLGEIAHHSLVDYFSSHVRTVRSLSSAQVVRRRLKSCSAMALARATGLPRETVRRKIIALEERGWLERTPDRRVRITPKVAKSFLPTFNVELVESLLDTSDAIGALLED